MTRVWLLFDLDMTLMVADGAGSAAMRRAFALETHDADPLAGVGFHRRTDGWIISEVARRSGVEPGRLRARYEHDYPRFLREELATRRPYVLPGVRELLAALERHDDAAYCLATGNQREASFAKLAAVGLDRHFDGGGFGDRHEQRSEMLRQAMDHLGWRAGQRLVVVGDSEHDVAGARAVHAFSVAVATGDRSEAELAAAGADSVLPDLGDLDRALGAMLG